MLVLVHKIHESSYVFLCTTGTFCVTNLNGLDDEDTLVLARKFGHTRGFVFSVYRVTNDSRKLQFGIEPIERISFGKKWPVLVILLWSQNFYLSMISKPRKLYKVFNYVAKL